MGGRGGQRGEGAVGSGATPTTFTLLMLAKCWPNTGVDDVHTGVNIGRRRELFCLWPCLSTHNAQIDCTESLSTQSTLTCSLMSSGVPLSKRPGATPSRGRGVGTGLRGSRCVWSLSVWAWTASLLREILCYSQPISNPHCTPTAQITPNYRSLKPASQCTGHVGQLLLAWQHWCGACTHRCVRRSAPLLPLLLRWRWRWSWLFLLLEVVLGVA